MKKRLLIIGCGDLGQLIAHHAINDNHYNVVGFLDDFTKKGASVNGIKVLGNLKDISELKNQNIFDLVMIGVGYKHMAFRKKLYEDLSENYLFGSIIHSSSFIDKSSKIGNGVFILPGCTIDKGVIIGNNVLLNTSVTIAHDSKVNSHCFLAPCVNIAGKSVIDECCFIGINTTIIDNIKINSNISIGGGSLVTKDLIKSGLYFGSPVKIIKS